MLFLSEPPEELGLPAGLEFLSLAVLRNTADEVVLVRPVVKHVQMGKTQANVLPEVVLAPGELRLVDLSQLRAEGWIPAQVHQGSLELQCQGPAGAVIAEMASFTEDHDFIVASSFASRPTRGVGGRSWRVDEAWETLVTVTNATDSEDEVEVVLHHEEGNYRLPPITMESGGIHTINVKELWKKQVPDVRGEVLPTDVTSGSLSILGSHGARSAISAESIVLNCASSIIIDDGGGGTNGTFVTEIDTSLSSTPFIPDPPPATATYDIRLKTDAYWNDGTRTVETEMTTYTSSNLSLASPFDGKFAFVRVNPAAGGTAEIYSEAVLVGCSAGSFQVFAIVPPPITFGIRLSAYRFDGPVPEMNGCSWVKTCKGKCSANHIASVNQFGTCFTGNNLFLQCTDLTVNGVCKFLRVICIGKSTPGICS